MAQTKTNSKEYHMIQDIINTINNAPLKNKDLSNHLTALYTNISGKQDSIKPIVVGKMIGSLEVIFKFIHTPEIGYPIGYLTGGLQSDVYIKERICEDKFDALIFDTLKIQEKNPEISASISRFLMKCSPHKSEHNINSMTDDDAKILYSMSQIKCHQEFVFGKVIGILMMLDYFEKEKTWIKDYERYAKGFFGYISGLLYTL